MTTPRRTLSAVAPLLALVLLTGCSAAEDAAQDAGDAVREEAEGAASEAVGSATSAAADAVRDQICGVVADADVSAQDIQVLQGLVDAADAAGLDAEVLEPARQIAEAGDTAPADATQQLTEACAP